MHMTPKISYVVAVYNVSEYVGKCAQSLFEQTLDDIEIIFCDDASSDNSLQVIQDMLGRYPHRRDCVRFICNETNQGTPTNRWNGVKAATGEYLQFVDGDDYLDVAMGEKLYNKAISTKADMVQCDCFYVSPNGVTAHNTSMPMADQRAYALDRNGWHTIWNRLFRRSLFDSDQLVWPKCHMADDLVISSVFTALAQKVVYYPEPLYYYNYNPNSIMNRRGESEILNRFDQLYENTKVLTAFYERQGLSEQFERGYLMIKSDTRNAIIDLTNKRKYRKLWYRTYPEINKIIFWGNKDFPSSYRNKIWFLAIMLGLYPRCKRLLLSKRLRPAIEWRALIPLKKQ